MYALLLFYFMGIDSKGSTRNLTRAISTLYSYLRTVKTLTLHIIWYFQKEFMNGLDSLKIE